MKKNNIALSLLLVLTFSQLYAKTTDVVLRIRNDESDEKVITKENLVKIKKFIIKKGLRQTYCNMYNNNPFYGTESYSFYLNPDSGQKNNNCELDKSDFNTLAIRNSNKANQYQNIKFSDKYYIYIEVSWPTDDLTVSEMRCFVTEAIEEIIKEIEKEKPDKSDAGDCNSSNDGVAYLKSLEEEGLLQPLTLEERLQILTPVFDSFAGALEKIASKYPETTGYSRDKAINQSEDTISCEHSYNFTRPHMKRDILPSDFGENGFTVRLSCKAMPPLNNPAYAMPPPALQLDNLQFYVWFVIGTAPNPSPGLIDEANMIILSHLEKLREADGIAPKDPNKIHVVLEILDRSGFRDAMPPGKKITLEEYKKIKNKYISNNEHWRPGFAFTYEVKENQGTRGYWMPLVSFNSKIARIAELTQFKSKGWDWIALYNVDRCDVVDKDFCISKIAEERSRAIGGVWYGMRVADVIQLKGRHFKIHNHAEGGSAYLVYDDVKISVRQWGPGTNTGGVVDVGAISNQTKEYMKDIPYEDEK